MTNLKELYIHDCKLLVDIGQFVLLTNLDTLHIINCPNIKSDVTLENMTTLKDLHISNNTDIILDEKENNNHSFNLSYGIDKNTVNIYIVSKSEISTSSYSHQTYESTLINENGHILKTMRII